MVGNPSTRTVLVIAIVATVAVVIGFAAGFTFASNSPSTPEDCKPDCSILLINGTNYWLTGDSYQSYKGCLSGNCTLVTVEDDMYILKGDAYKAYQNIENIAQVHMMKLDLQFLDDETGYLVNIDGQRTEIDRLVDRYNISEEHVKLYAESSNFKSVYGLIFKKDLIRFLEENDAHSLSNSMVMVARVGSVSTGDITIDNPFKGGSQDLASEYQEISENELARILSEESGVIKTDKDDLIRATHQVDQSTLD